MSEELLTSVVGSHAHPGWFDHAIAAAERGEYGPADLEELLDDGVELAIRDQERAGIDVITDGEMRRAGFFTAEFYRHLTGVRALPASRRLGVAAHDALPRFAVETRDRGAERPRRRRRVREGPSADGSAVQGHAAGAVHLVGAARQRFRRGLPDPRRRGGGLRPDPARRDPRPRRRRRRDHPGRRAIGGDPPERRRGFRVAPQRGPGAGSRPRPARERICASATSWGGRWRLGPTARSSTRCSASMSRSWCSNTRTAR